jgi:MarR family transcriptional regulator, transcriptional regulator for hemolysin
MAPQAGERVEPLLLESPRRLAVRMRAAGDNDLTTAGPGTAFVRAGEPAPQEQLRSKRRAIDFLPEHAGEPPKQNRKIDDELRRRLRQIDALVFAIGVMLFAVAAAATHLYWEYARPFVATDDPVLAPGTFSSSSGPLPQTRLTTCSRVTVLQRTPWSVEMAEALRSPGGRGRPAESPQESPPPALTHHFEAEVLPAALDNDLLVLLHDAGRQLSTYANARAQILGVTRAQLIVLTRLERQPDVSQSELADVAEVTPMTIARLVDRLEELGLVERCTDPQDRRVQRLRLTPAASPILREIKRLQPKLRSAVTKGIDLPVLKAMALGLNCMKENVRRSLTEATHKDGRNPGHSGPLATLADTRQRNTSAPSQSAGPRIAYSVSVHNGSKNHAAV